MLTEKDIKKIFQKLLPKIKKIYISYSFLGLTKEKFLELAEEFIKDIYNKNKGQDLKEEYYIKNLQRYLYMYTKVLLEEQTKFIKIIENFIEQKILIKSSSTECIEELLKLCIFLENYEYIPNPDVCIEIVKTNKKLNDIIEKIINENIEIVLTKGINNLNKNENKGNNGEFYESYFTDDCVLIMIDHETSLTDKIFTAADFPGVDVKEVVYLSSKEGLVNMEEYNHILKIELNTHGKDKVLEAIEILEEFDFVEVAEPNYIGYVID